MKKESKIVEKRIKAIETTISFLIDALVGQKQILEEAMRWEDTERFRSSKKEEK